MPAALKLTGKKFGYLTVIGPFKSVLCGDRKRRFWRCVCKCEKICWIEGSSLLCGNNVSCGSCSKTTHNLSTNPTYRIWASMLSRCRNPNDDGYYLYGGRGIKVCRRWYLFKNFYADMGERPKGKSIERKNTDGGYTPLNCVWATSKEQAANRRTTKLSFEIADSIRIDFKRGLIKADIARKYGVSFSAICRVLDNSRWVRQDVAKDARSRQG